MNNQDRQELQKIIAKFKELADSAYMRANTIIDNGVEVPEEYKYQSLGYYGAYTFCILVLNEYLNGRKWEWEDRQDREKKEKEAADKNELDYCPVCGQNKMVYVGKADSYWCYGCEYWHDSDFLEKLINDRD